MVHNVGCDIGYAFTKVLSGGRSSMFPSVVGSAETPSFALDVPQRILLHQSDGDVLAGQGAVTHSRFLQRREDRSWIHSSEYSALVDAALSEVISDTSASVRLVSGLPISYYSADAPDLRNLLRGTRHIRREGRQEQAITVEQVRVIPQPFGAVMSVAFDGHGRPIRPDLLTGAVGVVDVGGHTVNLLVVVASEEVARVTSSVDIGVWDVVRAVREHLCVSCRDLRASDHILARAVKERTISYYGRSVDLESVVAPVLEHLSGRIIATISQLWGGGAELDHILICGGGSHLVGDQLRSHFARHGSVTVLDEPEFANARGFLQFAHYLSESGKW